ncbi:FliH/SctL family protein [Sporofaciens musculi]|uniref:FliH/SctL family protein n=1 Tax=Sporofaciens musculi TaxID=2681861 RepID=UPI001FCCB8B8|nr:hypothetical protein [Sporofaciens musculi]
MKSLPRIVKEPEKKEDVKPYDFFAGFKLIEEPKEEDEDSEGDAEEDEENAVSVEEILEEARAQARQIINDARSQAEYLRDQGYREGQETGRQDGTREAYDEQRRLLDAEIQELQNNISEVIQSVSVEKEKLLEQYVDDLKRISLTVAEKVIQTSLQSSGDIVKRMILAATDKITKNSGPRSI